MIGALVGGLIGGAVGGYVAGGGSSHTVYHTEHIHHQADPKKVAHAIITEFMEMRKRRFEQLTNEAEKLEDRQRRTCAFCGKEIRVTKVKVNRDIRVSVHTEYERGDKDSVFVTLCCGCHQEEVELIIYFYPFSSDCSPYGLRSPEAEFFRTDVFNDCTDTLWTRADRLCERRCNILNNRGYGPSSSLNKVWDGLKRFYTQWDADEHDGVPHPTAKVRELLKNGSSLEGDLLELKEAKCLSIS